MDRPKSKVMKDNGSCIDVGPEVPRIDVYKIPSIAERSKARLIQKERKLAQQRFLLQQSHSFTPQISRESQRLAAQNARNIAPINDRLYQDATMSKQHKQQLAQEVRCERLSECSFTPKIDAISSLVVEEGGFFKRQEDALRKRKAYREIGTLGIVTDPECTFKPNTNRTVRPRPLTPRKQVNDENIPISDENRLTETDRSHQANVVTSRSSSSQRKVPTVHQSRSIPQSSESEAERIHRLSVLDQQKKEQAIQKVKEREDARVTFKPKINPISAIVARNRTVDELTRGDEIRAARQLAEERVKREHEVKCTFKPKIKGTTAPKETIQEQLQDLAMKRQEKERQIIEQQKKQEYEELKQCTFEPTINRTNIAQSHRKEVAVAGLLRFMELKRMGEEKKQEDEERKRQIFHLDGCRDIDLNGAVWNDYVEPKSAPQPDEDELEEKKKKQEERIQRQLRSAEEKGKQKRRMYAEKEKEEHDHITFQPKTNANRRRKMLDAILQAREETSRSDEEFIEQTHTLLDELEKELGSVLDETEARREVQKEDEKREQREAVPERAQTAQAKSKPTVEERRVSRTPQRQPSPPKPKPALKSILRSSSSSRVEKPVRPSYAALNSRKLGEKKAEEKKTRRVGFNAETPPTTPPAEHERTPEQAIRDVKRQFWGEEQTLPSPILGTPSNEHFIHTSSDSSSMIIDEIV
ncbi:hypothetical protein BLNAU_7950 [Blattamonas nauphoetae]|uniref:Uncharacterized protein n=1 Tax=Blattamonas nauphoetae TaxID=2049346 RepID=A0ABQ9Y074_9EUKA|nr:hypothetical protein BLNAU_7950 [Blattamonas nauphoetae]